MDEGVQLLELARNAQLLFAKQEPREKRRLLNFVLSNCTWGDGEVVATFREPSDLLAETTMIAQRSTCSAMERASSTSIPRYLSLSGKADTAVEALPSLGVATSARLGGRVYQCRSAIPAARLRADMNP